MWAVHEIGYIDDEKSGKTVYFDLTAKAYVFTRYSKKHRGDAESAVMEGVVVIDDLNSTEILRSLYQSDWDKVTTLSKERIASILYEKGQKFLRKQ